MTMICKKSDQGGLPKQAASRTDSSRTHIHLYTLVIFVNYTARMYDTSMICQ